MNTERAGWQNARDQIKRRVSVPEVLRDLRVKSRGRKRCDCPFCTGSQKGTLSFTDDLWNCFRCAEEARAGDVFNLVERAHNCSFMDALKFLAEQAGIRLPGRQQLSEDDRRSLAQEQARRERIAAEARRLADEERALRAECRTRIHQCDAVLDTPPPWDEAMWKFAADVCTLRDEPLLPEYALLSFAVADVRMTYVKASELERVAMATAVWRAGGVMANGGKFLALEMMR